MTPDDLVEIRRIEELKYRYVRCLDLKLWEDLEDVLTEDATARFSGGALDLDGRAAILQFFRDTMGSTSMLTSHKVHQPEIDLGPGRTEATATWALDDVVVHAELGMTITGAAFYDDRYVQRDGRWLIAATGYKRVYEEIYPRKSVEGLRLTAEYWATDGRSRLI